MKIGRIDMHLALMNERFLRREDIFNRVLNSEDMLRSGIVDAVDHGGERVGLALPHRPHNKKESLLALCENLKHRGKVEFGEGVYLVRNESERECRRALHKISIDTETCVFIMRIGKIDGLIF